MLWGEASPGCMCDGKAASTGTVRLGQVSLWGVVLRGSCGTSPRALCTRSRAGSTLLTAWTGQTTD